MEITNLQELYDAIKPLIDKGYGETTINVYSYIEPKDIDVESFNLHIIDTIIKKDGKYIDAQRIQIVI